jgi:hypothetical protein
MNRPLEHEFSGEGESPQRSPSNNMRDQEWAVELRKADERTHEVRLRSDDLGKKI